MFIRKVQCGSRVTRFGMMFLWVLLLCIAPLFDVSAAWGAASHYTTSRFSLEIESDTVTRIDYVSSSTTSAIQSVKRTGAKSVQVSFATDVEAIYSGEESGMSDFGEAIKNNFTIAGSHAARVILPHYPNDGERMTFSAVDVVFEDAIAANATLSYNHIAGNAAFGVPASAKMAASFSSQVEENVPLLQNLTVSGVAASGNPLAFEGQTSVYTVSSIAAGDQVTITATPAAGATCKFILGSQETAAETFAPNLATGLSTVRLQVSRDDKSITYTIYMIKAGADFGLSSVKYAAYSSDDGEYENDDRQLTLTEGYLQAYLPAVTNDATQIRFQPVTSGNARPTAVRYGAGNSATTPAALDSGYYVIPLATGDNRIEVTVTSESNATITYSFLITRSDEAYVLQSLRLIGVKRDGASYDVPFDKPFSGSLEADAEGCVSLSTAELSANLYGIDSFYFEAEISRGELCVGPAGETPEQYAAGGILRSGKYELTPGEENEFSIYMIVGGGAHAAQGTKYKISIPMSHYEPAVAIVRAYGENSLELLSADFGTGDSVTITVPVGVDAIELYAEAPGAEKYINTSGAAHPELAFLPLTNFTVGDAGFIRGGPIATSQYMAPVEVHLVVQNKITGASKTYKVTIKSAFTSVQNVYFGMTRANLDEAKLASIRTDINGGYFYTYEGKLGSIGKSSCFGWSPVNQAPTAKFETSFPFCYYPTDAENAAEIEFLYDKSVFHVTVEHTGPGEGTLHVKKLDWGRLQAPVEGNAGLIQESGVMVTASLRGETLAELEYEINIPSDQEVFFPIITVTETVKEGTDVGTLYEGRLPILSPAFAYSNPSLPLIVQVGQKIDVSCVPLIKTYGQFVEYRNSPGAKWDTAWTEYGPSSVLDDMTQEMIGYSDRSKALLYFPHDGVDYYLDVNADPRRGNEWIRNLYTNAGQYFKLESLTGNDMMPCVRITGLEPLPEYVDYLYLTGRTRLTGELTHMMISCISGENVKKNSQVYGSALVVQPKSFYFERKFDGTNPDNQDYLNMYGWCAASSASYALGGTFHAIVVSGIAMGLEVALDMARDLLVKDGSVYVTWKNLEVNVPVQYGTKNYQWAIDFVEAGDIQTDGVTWNLNNNSVHLRDDGKRNYVFAENSRLRKSSGQSYPGLVAVFPRDATATADSAAQFFRQYPELLPLVGGNPNKVRGLYGPFQVAVKGTIKDTRIPIENHVAFFCTEPLASSSGTTASALSARTAPLTVATMQAAGGTGSLARAAEAASSTETTRERLFLSNFRRADDCDSWLCAVDTDGAVKMTIDLSEAQLDGKEIEYVVPTVLGAKNIVVRDAQGNEIRQGGWEIFEQTTVIKPETDATAATFAINAANADPNHIMLEFDVLDGMVNRAEVVEVLVKYAGDETLYAVAPEGDGPNGGFRVDAAAVRSASYGGSSSGCSTGTAALAVAASAALLAAVQNIRRKRK